MNHIAYIFLSCFLLSFTTMASTTQNQDSISFETQRTRVNDLLDQRGKKFGDYTTSLEQKTGIFGLFKTKNDMQKSIDILKSIVINDNAIFIETRKLLDLKDNQAERYQNLAQEYDQQVTAYMKTISKLQKENDQLREQITALQDQGHKDNNLLYIALLLLLGLGFAFTYYTLRKKQNVTKV